MNNTTIGCIHVAFCPEHPIDQKNCIIEPCPICKKPMWVSEKKRAIRASGLRCACLLCLALEAIESNSTPKLIDINDTH